VQKRARQQVSVDKRGLGVLDQVQGGGAGEHAGAGLGPRAVVVPPEQRARRQVNVPSDHGMATGGAEEVVLDAAERRLGEHDHPGAMLQQGLLGAGQQVVRVGTDSAIRQQQAEPQEVALLGDVVGEIEGPHVLGAVSVAQPAADVIVNLRHTPLRLQPEEECLHRARPAGAMSEDATGTTQAMNDAGGYRWVATARYHMAFEEPDNAEAKNLLADALTQMGHQTKIGLWRNFQLSGAKERRDGVVEAAPPCNRLARHRAQPAAGDLPRLSRDAPEPPRGRRAGNRAQLHDG